MSKTLVKSKIVFEKSSNSVITYFWKPSWWIFGYWYPYGVSQGGGERKFDHITDDTVSDVLYENFIRGKYKKTEKTYSPIK